MNAFVMNSITFPSLYRQRGCSKRDFLAFHLDIIKQLIVKFWFHQRSAGQPRSAEYHDPDRLNVLLGHWLVRVENLNVLLCNKTKQTEYYKTRNAL